MTFIMPPVETRRAMTTDDIIREIEEGQSTRDMIAYQFRKFNWLCFELDVLVVNPNCDMDEYVHIRRKMEHIVTTLIVLGWDFDTPSIGRENYRRMRVVYKSMKDRNNKEYKENV